MIAKEEELLKVKEKQIQAEEQLKEYEAKQQQVSLFEFLNFFFFLRKVYKPLTEF